MWYTLSVSGTPTRKEGKNVMRQEKERKILGENYDVLDQHKCKNGFTIKFMDDDWGWYVKVMDEQRYIHYNGKIHFDKEIALAEYDEIIQQFRYQKKSEHEI